MLKRVGTAMRQHPLLLIAIVIQVGLISYLNLFCLDRYIGYDCSSYYLQAIEIWKQKTLLISNWEYQTTICWDSPVLLAALLYGVFGNIFTAYGLANIICGAILIFEFIYIARQMELPLKSKMIAVILLLTPYVLGVDTSNDIRYFRMLFFAHGAYVVKISIMLLIWICFVKFDQQDKRNSANFFGILSCLLCVMAGMSSGLYVCVFGIIPAIAYFIVKMVKEDTRTKTNWKPLLYLFCCAVCELIGVIFAKKVLHFECKDMTTVWTNLVQFWDNLFSIVGGYFKLTGALPVIDQITVFSSEGIPYGFSFLISVFMLVAGSIGVIKSLIKFDKNSFFAFVCAFDIIIFVPIFTTYGTYIFEERYLIPFFVILILFVALWIENHVLFCKNKSWNILISGGLAVCVLVVNVNSYLHIDASQNQYAEMEEIKIAAKEYDTDLVYVAGGQIGILARNIRAYDDSRIYKYTGNLLNPHHWGDYTYYDDAYGYEGSTMLVTTEDFYNTSVSDYFKTQFEFKRKVGESILIFVADGANPFDFITGPSGEFSKDYMYTTGIIYSEGTFFETNGTLNTNGVSGYVTFGPYVNVNSGIYDFILNYQVISGQDLASLGTFDIAIDMQSIQVVEIDANQTQVIISDVNLEENSGLLEYRVYLQEGAQLILESYEFVKKN